MDVLVRRRSLVLVSRSLRSLRLWVGPPLRFGPPILILVAGCSPAPGAPVGVSDPKARPRASSIASAAPNAPNPIPADFRAKYTKLGARFPSAGHFVGRYDAVIWASEDARDPWNQQASFPDGARLVMEHLRRGADEVGPLLMMERRNGSWRWIMVASDNRVILDGDSNACAQCHAEAPRDSVFFVR